MYAEKLIRKVQKIFGLDAENNQVVEFGSPTNGRAVYSKDVENIQTTYYEGGWFPESLSGNIRPYAEDMNGLHYVHSYQLAYLLQAGIPEWDAKTPYFKNCIVRGRSDLSSSNIVGRTLYISETDNNSNNEPWLDDTGTNWTLFTLGETAVPVGASLEWNGMQVPNAKWHFEDGSFLEASLYPALYAVIGDIFGSKDETINGETVHYFALPNSTGRVALGYSSGELALGQKGGQFNHQHFVPSHNHGVGNIEILNSGSHTHAVAQGSHTHSQTNHQHLFRFGDYGAEQKSGGVNVATLGSKGLTGSDATPTKVNWQRGVNGANTGHFYKMTSGMVPNGGSLGDVNQPLTTGAASPAITCGATTHAHPTSVFRGKVGNPNGRNGDEQFLTISSNNETASSNMPFVVKRKIIRILP